MSDQQPTPPEHHRVPRLSRRRALIDMSETAATMIADGTGTSLWSSTGAKSYADVRLRTDQRCPVITWWESPGEARGTN